MVEAYLNGIFPRSKALIAATRGLDRGRVSVAGAQEALEQDVRDLVALQLEAGFGYLSDGLLNWQDLFRPLVEAWEGLELGGLTRWFDNNTFYRQPVMSAPLLPHAMAKEFTQVGLLHDTHAWQAVLPGPYTFLTLAENHHYGSPREALHALTDGLKATASALREEGFRLLHFQEPALAVNPPDGDGLADLREAYEHLRVPGTKAALHLFFGSAQPLLPDLLDFPIDMLGLDLYQEDLDRLKDVDFTKTMVCGCVDARNSHLEEPAEVAGLVARLREELDPPEVILAPNADLEFLPRSVARAKVEVLGAATKQLEEAG
jgi:5-methyltetrahydropteroyltriglutamate--homocysteine methyltransferase